MEIENVIKKPDNRKRRARVLRSKAKSHAVGSRPRQPKYKLKNLQNAWASQAKRFAPPDGNIEDTNVAQAVPITPSANAIDDASGLSPKVQAYIMPAPTGVQSSSTPVIAGKPALPMGRGYHQPRPLRRPQRQHVFKPPKV